MTRNEVLLKLQEIFRDIFDEANMHIENETNAEDIEDWDSLNHVNLITAVEQEFSIRFALGELGELQDVGSMIDFIMVKIQ
ncbi:acyl carrier protein [Gammaproteobacteria bacterium]|nr:acyl carrier protein [Gammaproteobacteria bacterium]